MNNLNSSPLPKEIVPSMMAIRAIGLKLVFKNGGRNEESQKFFPELVTNRIGHSSRINHRKAEKNDSPFEINYSNHFEILTPKGGLEESGLYHVTIEHLGDKGIKNIGGFEFIFHRDKEMLPKIHDKIAFAEFLGRFIENMEELNTEEKVTKFRLRFELDKSAGKAKQVVARVGRAISNLAQNSRAKRVEKRIRKNQPE